eukprot:gene39303-53126_t
MLLALGILFVVAQIPPQRLMALAVPLYALGVALLVATMLFGITKKGATRWLNLGVIIQPSEILKIAMPLMLAWWFQKREGQLRPLDFAVAGLLLVVPVGLVMKQPDLGTALLILSSGVYVIFFAGLSWKLILPVLLLVAAAVVALVASEPTICQDGVTWHVLREYQKHRVCTLLDPSTDPLGKGFHIIQSTIAIGSGGLTGKGWKEGTQAHLEFIPERTTDFIFAAYSEEFGLIGEVGLGTVKAGYEAKQMVAWARKYGIQSTIHTGGPSVPGSGKLNMCLAKDRVSTFTYVEFRDDAGKMAEEVCDRMYGPRPLKRLIQRSLQNLLESLILEGAVVPGGAGAGGGGAAGSADQRVAGEGATQPRRGGRAGATSS